MRKLFLFTISLLLLTSAYAQWEQVGGPTGAHINDLLYVGDDIWAASSGGLYISSDDGDSWKKSDLLPSGHTIEDLKFINRELFVVSTDIVDEISVYRFEEIFIHRSSDGGRSFTTSSIIRSDTSRGVGLDAYCKISGQSGRLFLTTTRETFISLNNGLSWSVHTYPDAISGDLDGQLFSSEEILFYHHDYGISGHFWHYSIDNAATWEQILVIPSQRYQNPIVHAAGDTLFRVVRDSTIHYSLDRGRNWVNTDYFPENVEESGSGFWSNDAGYHLVGQPKALLFSGFDAVEREIDATDIDSIRCFLVNKSASVLVGTKSGLYKFEAGETIPVDLSSQFRSAFVGNLSVSPIGELFHIRDSTLYKSSDQGETWSSIAKSGMLSNVYDRFYHGANKFSWPSENPDSFLVISQLGLHLTTDGGLSFSRINDYSSPIVRLDDFKNGVLNAFLRDSLYYSTNLGEDWIKYGNLTSVTSRPIIESVFGEFFDIARTYDAVYITRDRGLTWELTSWEPEYGIRIFQLDDKSVVSTNKDWYVSNDTGQTWTTFQPDGLRGYLPLDTKFDLRFINGVYFAHIALNGILTSPALEGPWIPLDDNLGTRLSTTSCISSDGVFYLGTENGGIWRNGSTVSRLEGYVYEDVDRNGVYSQIDTAFQGAIVTSLPLDYSAVSRRDGSFATLYRSSIDTLRPSLPFLYGNISPEYILTDTSQAPFVFLAEYESGKDDLAVNLIPQIHRPGFETCLTFFVENRGTTDLPANCYVIAPAGITLTPVTGVYTTSGDTTFFSFPEIKFHESIRLKFNVQVDRLVVNGAKLCYKANVNFNIGNTLRQDLAPENNTTTECLVVVGSYDPNDKQVSPDLLDPRIAYSDQRLSYTIRFQNTGTYYAENVEVRDYLSSKLDLSTIRIDAVSHQPYEWSLSGGRMLSVLFEDIMLPDSTNNEPESHGFVKFSVLPKGELELEEIITNKAGIYFDFNDPIITNEVVTRIATSSNTFSPLSQLSLKLFPNPSSKSVTILLEESVSGAARVAIVDIQGRNVFQRPLTLINGQGRLDVTDLLAGNYQLQILVGGKSYTGQVTVAR